MVAFCYCNLLLRPEYSDKSRFSSSFLKIDDIWEQFLVAAVKTLPKIADFCKLFPPQPGPDGEKYLPLLTKSKEILCTVCPSKFRTKNHFRIHFETVHEGKRPFKCSECGKDFAQRQNLREHVSAVHEKKKPHLCFTCGIGFADKGNLTKHIAAVHKGIRREQWKSDGTSTLTSLINNDQ